MTVFEKSAREIQGQLVAWRRYLHQIPEVGLETLETSGYIAGELKKMGVEVTTGVGGHGVVGLIKGGKPGRTLGIRADIDGLPIQEETGLPFASRKPGKMHACGHDTHAAMALGAAKLVVAMKNQLAGNVKFIFQPAEEGPGGAKPMIEAGVMENPKVDGVIGLHIGGIWKEVPFGHIGCKPGPMMASMDRFEARIRGKGGHGALPHKTVDVISIACQAVTALQTIVSREVNPLDPAVVTVGKIISGVAFNVIPGEAIIEGTVRALQPDVRAFLKQRIGEVLKGVVGAMRGEVQYAYTEMTPPVVNEPEFARMVLETAITVIGNDLVHEVTEPTMGGEDFAFYLEKAPGAFFTLGGCNEDRGQTFSHHNPKFDVDEDVFWKGSAVFAAFAAKYLSPK